MVNLKFEILSNRLEKMAMLFELYDRLDKFFYKNKDLAVEISFMTEHDLKSDNKYIQFSCSLDENKNVVFSHVFNEFFKLVCLYDPYKSPFGALSWHLKRDQQKTIFNLNRDNFKSIFEYADDFDGKKEWISLLGTDNLILNNDLVLGEYPELIFNQQSYDLWNKIKNSDNYIKNTLSYNDFLSNIKIIKKHYENLKNNQHLILKREYLTIIDDSEIIESIELRNFKRFSFDFDFDIKKNENENSLIKFIENKKNIIKLYFSLNDSVIDEICRLIKDN